MTCILKTYTYTLYDMLGSLFSFENAQDTILQKAYRYLVVDNDDTEACKCTRNVVMLTGACSVTHKPLVQQRYVWP